MAFIVFTVVGCNSNTQPATTSTNAGDERTPIQLQLNWIPDAQHGGFYAAESEGFFAKAGFDVQIVPGGPGTAVIPKLAMGRCDFAIANADQVLLARVQDADVVAVFAAMQNSPRCIMVHESSGIERLDQLANLTLALGDGKAFAEYMKSKLPLKNVRIVSYSGSVAKFLIDKDFAQQGYVFSEPIMAKQQGGDPRALMVSEIGFNPYSSVVITRRETLETKPEMVAKFVGAVRDGWKAYLASPQAANELIRHVSSSGNDTSRNTEMLAKSAVAIKPLCLPTDDTELGHMSLERWTTLREQLIELKLLSADSPDAASAFSLPASL